MFHRPKESFGLIIPFLKGIEPVTYNPGEAIAEPVQSVHRQSNKRQFAKSFRLHKLFSESVQFNGCNFLSAANHKNHHHLWLSLKQ